MERRASSICRRRRHSDRTRTSITDRLEHWARESPSRVFLAQRDGTGGWRTVTYAETLECVGRVSQALLNRRLSRERPILILSGNGIDHALLALAAMHVGVPYAPIAPAYSLQAKEFGTLQQIFERLTPGLVFAADGAAFERALSQVLPASVELVTSTSVTLDYRVDAVRQSARGLADRGGR